MHIYWGLHILILSDWVPIELQILKILGALIFYLFICSTTFVQW